MVVAEALSFGLPVVCLDNSGPGEFIDESCAYAVSPQSYDKTIEGLSDSIVKLYNDPKLRAKMSQNARLRYENYFDWNLRGEQLKSIYQTL